MAENKTKPTDVSVDSYIAAIASDQQRADAERLITLLKKITKHEPKMWGPSIVGFDSYHYKYESGREGDMCATGFAARKSEMVVYLTADGEDQETLRAKLGKHKMGKSCLYFKRLDDLDAAVLEKMIRGSLKAVKARYPN